MTATEHIPPTISEPLSWEEICRRYPDEWVCLVEIDRPVPQDFEFRTARVVGHGKTRREPLDQARRWREHYKTIGHYFTEHLAARPRCVPTCFVRVDIPMGMRRFYPCHESCLEIAGTGDAPTVQLDGEP
jgi:hypothetical protein